MKGAPKVSVVIPVYGVEKYVERCARSLFEQTLDDIEYIFVDDCTPDNSISVLRAVLEEYPMRLSQTKILNHDINKGLPASRKTGLSVASGEYVIHCDSDDWVDRNYYERLYDIAVAENADIVISDYISVSKSGEHLRIGLHSTQKKEAIVNFLNRNDSGSLCNKLVRRTILDKPFVIEDGNNMGEDLCLTMQIIRYCDRISYVKGVHYYYDCLTSSITRKETKEACISRARQACANASVVASVYSDSKDKDIKNGIVKMKYLQRKLLMPIINNREAFIIWKSTFPEINCAVILSPQVKIPFVERVKFFLTLIGVFPWVKEHFRKNIC